jgi:spore maturation protein CgeB
LNLLPFNSLKTPRAILQIASGPLFGVDLYKALSRAKIVLNGAIDIAGKDRGNIRCFEAMGAGCALLSDEGQYPEALLPNENLKTYSSSTSASAEINALLEDPESTRALGRRAHRDVAAAYSKEKQFEAFCKLVA